MCLCTDHYGPASEDVWSHSNHNVVLLKFPGLGNQIIIVIDVMKLMSVPEAGAISEDIYLGGGSDPPLLAGISIPTTDGIRSTFIPGSSPRFRFGLPSESPDISRAPASQTVCQIATEDPGRTWGGPFCTVVPSETLSLDCPFDTWVWNPQSQSTTAPRATANGSGVSTVYYYTGRHTISGVPQVARLCCAGTAWRHLKAGPILIAFCHPFLLLPPFQPTSDYDRCLVYLYQRRDAHYWSPSSSCTRRCFRPALDTDQRTVSPNPNATANIICTDFRRSGKYKREYTRSSGQMCVFRHLADDGICLVLERALYTYFVSNSSPSMCGALMTSTGDDLSSSPRRSVARSHAKELPSTAEDCKDGSAFSSDTFIRQKSAWREVPTLLPWTGRFLRGRGSRRKEQTAANRGTVNTQMVEEVPRAVS
ncbi:hypothetical protein DFH06DRAFT_1139281 [Mycena polygramma]|nr:hypothetical protein DFH06DRAFT_1139281 [Mycena polygramma]